MKKLFISLFLLIFPSLVGFGVLYYFFSSDFKPYIDKVKKEVVKKFPELSQYIEIKPDSIIKDSNKLNVVQDLKKEIYKKNNRFKNFDVFEAICGRKPTDKLYDDFVGCEFCPQYLNYNKLNKNFRYLFEVHGKFSKNETGESLIFMKGCNETDQDVRAILLKKGYGGWQRKMLFQEMSFDKNPIKFIDSSGYFIFIIRNTIKSDLFIKHELLEVKFIENQKHEKVLFVSEITRGEKCRQEAQTIIDHPIKTNNKTFEISLEVIGCRKKILDGSYKLKFKLGDFGFEPTKNSSSLMTKVEKINEI